MAKNQSKKSAKTSTQPKALKKEAAPVAASPAPSPAPATPDPRLPAAGTLLQKLDRHGAVRCECAVEADGIHYQGTTYRSLSAAAMAAAKELGLENRTQNGFTFWGLSKPSRAPTDPLAALDRAWERYQGGAAAAVKGATDENRGAIAAAISKHAKAIESLRGLVA
jgi:hypothetical protein